MSTFNTYGPLSQANTIFACSEYVDVKETASCCSIVQLPE